MLRRLNAALAERGMPREAYVEWVRESIVKEVLAGRRDSPRATCLRAPGLGWTRSRADGSSGSASLGVDVVGDLGELQTGVARRRGGWSDPDQADPALVADLAIESLAHVLDRVGTRPVEPSPLETGAVARLARRLRDDERTAPSGTTAES